VRITLKRPSESRRRLRDAGGLIERAFGQVVPGAGRPQLRHREESDVVALRSVALDVHVPRGLGHDGERLQGQAALDQPRHVDMPARTAAQQVPIPQRGVGMQVGHEERGMDLPRMVAHLDGPTADPVHAPFGEARGETEQDGSAQNQQENHLDTTFHGSSLSRVDSRR
jgi:hypothetical protein